MQNFIFAQGPSDATILNLLPLACADPTVNGITLMIQMSEMVAGNYTNLDAQLALIPSPLLIKFNFTNTPPDTTKNYAFLTLDISTFGNEPVSTTYANPFDPTLGQNVINDYILAMQRAYARLVYHGMQSRFYGFCITAIISVVSDSELHIPASNNPPYDGNNAAMIAAWVAGGYTEAKYISIQQTIATAAQAIAPNIQIVFDVSDPITGQIGNVNDGGATVVAMASAIYSTKTNGCTISYMYESFEPGRAIPSICETIASLTDGLVFQAKQGFIITPAIITAQTPYNPPFIENHITNYKGGTIPLTSSNNLLQTNGSLLKINGSVLAFGAGTGSGAATPQVLAITGFNIALPTNYSFGGMGGVIATGGLGIYTYSINQSGISDTTYAMNTATGTIVFNGTGTYTAGRVDSFHVIVTDATGASASALCTVTYQVNGVIVPDAYLAFYNSQSTNSATTFNLFQPIGPGFVNGGNTPVIITDPSGVFSGTDFLYCHNSTWPAAGSYPLTCSAQLQSGGGFSGGNLVQNFTLQVINDPGPVLIQWTQETVTSSAAIGTVVGQALADGSAEYTSYALSNNAGGKYQINGLSGIVSVASALTAETDSITVVATRSGINFSQTVSVVVGTGVALPSSNMSMTVNSALTNAIINGSPVSVGTPSITGITGTPIWTLTQIHAPYAEQEGSTPRYAINSSTGSIIAQNTLSAQTDALTVSVTDGVNTCTKVFNVIVSAVVGPTLYVGQGMVAAHGATLSGGVQGFEHWDACYALFQSPNPTYAGSTIYVYSNSDPNYYANDNGNSLDPQSGMAGNYALRFGFYGPASIIGVQGSGGIRPRWGGVVGSEVGGVDIGAKGFLVLSGGDISISNMEFSDIHANTYQGGSSPESNSTGCAIRQNGQSYGNLTVNNCYIHTCDQGIETGDVPGYVTITNTEVYNCGGDYVSSGATHNIYISGNVGLTVNNLLSWNVINGHTLKTRAAGGTISNSRFYDTETGGASCQVDMPDGGNYVLNNNVFQKGPQPQNPNSVQYCAEMDHGYPVNNLLVENCTFINNTPVGFPVNGIYMYGRCMVNNGSYSTVQSTNNSFIGYTSSGNTTGSAAFVTGGGSSIVTGVSDGRPCAVTTTGQTILTSQPALSLLNPQTGTVSPRSITKFVLYDGQNRNNWINDFNYVIDSGFDDLRFSATTALNTILFTPTITPTIYWASQPSYVNPYASGGTWSIVAGASSYVGQLYTVAPVGKYSINSATGALKIAQTPTSGQVDNLIIACTANGVTTQAGIYVVWT